MMMIPRRHSFDLFDDMFEDSFFNEGESKLMKTDIKEKKDKLKPTLEPVLIPSQIAKETIVINKAKMDKLIKDSTILQVYKFVEFFLLFGVLMLNIGNFIYNQTSLTFSLNLFNINAYSFLLTNDVGK